MLNFVVNSLNEELPINLGEELKLSTEEFYQILG